MNKSKSSWTDWVAHALRRIAIAPLALLIVFEEWGWEPLARLTASIGRLPLLAYIERWIVALSPYAALVLFALPWFLLLPLKLFALWLIGNGHVLLGAAAVLAAKIAGTAVVARLFTLTRPALMRLAWFATVYERWRTWKDGLLVEVRASRAWSWGRAIKVTLRRRMRHWRDLLWA